VHKTLAVPEWDLQSMGCTKLWKTYFSPLKPKARRMDGYAKLLLNFLIGLSLGACQWSLP